MVSSRVSAQKCSQSRCSGAYHPADSTRPFGRKTEERGERLWSSREKTNRPKGHNDVVDRGRFGVILVYFLKP